MGKLISEKTTFHPLVDPARERAGIDKTLMYYETDLRACGMADLICSSYPGSGTIPGAVDIFYVRVIQHVPISGTKMAKHRAFQGRP